MNEHEHAAGPSEAELRWPAAAVDDLCDEFESAWRRGEPPCIDDYLARTVEQDRSRLFGELLDVELHWRRRRNEAPARDDYATRFPAYADAVSRGFASSPLTNSADSGLRREVLSPCETCSVIPKTELGCLGRYQLLAELGRGGMGVVYRARQCSADRIVALKVIRSDCFDRLSPEWQNEVLERFQHEVRAAARLQHENIVTIFEVGTVEGRPFFTMQYVDGTSLGDALRDGPLEARRAASYLAAVSRGVHEAHRLGILHRDIKPQNIVVEQATDVPRVMDFGLAKLRGGDDQLTRAGQMIGTPAFMSPEQAANAAEVGPESDVYALGATLYALLTGRPPFQAATPWETMRQVVSAEPVSPARLNPAIDRDLETICLKCLHKDRTRRYLSAAALAEDLTRFLRREPILARPVGRVERAARWCRRNPLMALLGLLAVVGVSGALVASTVGYLRVSAALRESDESFRQVRQAVEDLFTDVSENTLLNEPGMEPLRKQLLGRALVYYQRFLTEHANDATVRDELGLAYFRVAMITQTLDAPVKAIPVLRDAERLQRQLLAEQASAPRLQGLGNTLTALGRVFQLTRQLAAAEQAFSEAIDVRRRLAGQEESNAEFHRLLANSVMNLGLLKLERGDTEPALTDLEAAQAIRKTHVARADNRKLLRDLAKGYYNLATLYAERESLATAVARLGSAIEIFEQLVHDEPDELEQQKALAICWRVRGDLETDPARRGTMYHKARKVLDKLVQESPTVLDYQHERASVSMNLGDVLLEQSDRTAALAEFEEARRLLERLLAKTPENPRYGRDLGVVLRVLGEQQQAAGNSELAKRYLQQSVVLFDVLIGNHPGEEEFERLRALAVEAQHKLTVKE